MHEDSKTAKASATGNAARRPFVQCKACGGRAHQDGDGRPFGWLHLSVSVPRGIGRNGRPYRWIGEWCSAGCMAASMADLETAELRARGTYDADPPAGPGAAS